MIVFLQHISIHPGATFFLPDTRGIEIHVTLQPIETEMVFHKHFPNSFRETGLEECLQDLGIRQLVLCGMMSRIQSRTDFGTAGYGGACPPAKDAAHHYQFTIWALDVDELPLDENASAAMVGFFLHQHQLGRAVLTATYGR